MFIGPLMVIGGIAALFLVLDAPMPDAELLWILIIPVIWKISLLLFPEKKCRRCKGSGSWGIGFMLRECGLCHGSGRINRIGAGE